MKTIKLTVSLSEEVVKALQEMAAEQGTSVTEQLRRAVSIQKWLYDARKQRGARLLLEDHQGHTRELVFVNQ